MTTQLSKVEIFNQWMNSPDPEDAAKKSPKMLAQLCQKMAQSGSADQIRDQIVAKWCFEQLQKLYAGGEIAPHHFAKCACYFPEWLHNNEEFFEKVLDALAHLCESLTEKNYVRMQKVAFYIRSKDIQLKKIAHLVTADKKEHCDGSYFLLRAEVGAFRKIPSSTADYVTANADQEVLQVIATFCKDKKLSPELDAPLIFRTWKSAKALDIPSLIPACIQHLQDSLKESTSEEAQKILSAALDAIEDSLKQPTILTFALECCARISPHLSISPDLTLRYTWVASEPYPVHLFQKLYEVRIEQPPPLGLQNPFVKSVHMKWGILDLPTLWSFFPKIEALTLYFTDNLIEANFRPLSQCTTLKKLTLFCSSTVFGQIEKNYYEVLKGLKIEEIVWIDSETKGAQHCTYAYRNFTITMISPVPRLNRCGTICKRTPEPSMKTDYEFQIPPLTNLKQLSAYPKFLARYYRYTHSDRFPGHALDRQVTQRHIFSIIQNQFSEKKFPLHHFIKCLLCDIGWSSKNQFALEKYLDDLIVQEGQTEKGIMRIRKIAAWIRNRKISLEKKISLCITPQSTPIPISYFHFFVDSGMFRGRWQHFSTSLLFPYKQDANTQDSHTPTQEELQEITSYCTSRSFSQQQPFRVNVLRLASFYNIPHLAEDYIRFHYNRLDQISSARVQALSEGYQAQRIDIQQKNWDYKSINNRVSELEAEKGAKVLLVNRDNEKSISTVREAIKNEFNDIDELGSIFDILGSCPHGYSDLQLENRFELSIKSGSYLPESLVLTPYELKLNECYWVPVEPARKFSGQDNDSEHSADQSYKENVKKQSAFFSQLFYLIQDVSKLHISINSVLTWSWVCQQSPLSHLNAEEVTLYNLPIFNEMLRWKCDLHVNSRYDYSEEVKPEKRQVELQTQRVGIVDSLITKFLPKASKLSRLILVEPALDGSIFERLEKEKFDSLKALESITWIQHLNDKAPMFQHSFRYKNLEITLVCMSQEIDPSKVLPTLYGSVK